MNCIFIVRLLFTSYRVSKILETNFRLRPFDNEKFEGKNKLFNVNVPIWRELTMRRSFPISEHLIHSFDSFTQFTIIRIIKSHIMC